MLNLQRIISNQTSQGVILEPLTSLNIQGAQIMDKRPESCYQWAASSFLPPEWKTDPSFYYRFPFPMGNPMGFQSNFTEPSHITLRCPPAVQWELLCSKASSTCELLILHPARITPRRKLRQADKVTAAQVTRHRQYVPSFQLQTPSSHQALSSHVTLWTSAHPLVHVVAH